MVSHKNLTENEIHVVHAFTFADATARNAEVVTSDDIGKVARQTDNDSYYILINTTPTWSQIDSEGFDTFLELNDTPFSYSGQAGNILQVNTGATAVEFGQALRTTDSPTFNNLTLDGDLTVQGTVTTLNTETLLVEDKNIELGVVATPTDLTADGGGITLKGTTDKTIIWRNTVDAWEFNQDVLIQSEVSIGGLTSPATDASLDLKATNKALLQNRLTTIQRDALTAVAGMTIYNSTANDIEYFNGTSWVSIGGGDVVGPATSVATSVATFLDTGGKNIQDPNTMFIDSINNRVGINTTTPNTTLQVQGALSNTNIIIGDKADTNPALKLWGNHSTGYAYIQAGGTSSNANLRITKYQTTTGNLTDFQIYSDKTYFSGKVGIGTLISDTLLHIHNASAGVVTAFADTVLTVENNLDAYISILAPSTKERGILFGDEISNVSGGIIYNSGNVNGFQFRVDGGQTKMVLESVGNLGLGTITPDGVLDVTSITDGSLPVPRMTTVQKDAITTPATALQVFDTDFRRYEFFDGIDWVPSEAGALNIVYFTDASQLPAPVSGVITLEANTVYMMYNDDPTTSQKVIFLSDRLQIPDAGGIRISGTGVATAILAYTGTGAFITTSSNFTGFLQTDGLFFTCPSGTFLDIDGVLPVTQEFFPRLFLTRSGVFDTASLGTIKNVNTNFNIGAFFSCKQGLVLDHVEEALIGDWRFANWLNDTGAVMLTAKNSLRFPKISGCTFETLANETAFNIKPSIGEETFIITGNSYRGTGTLYATGASGSFTIVDDVSTSGTITASAGTAVGETIFTDVAHGLVIGQIITQSGFATETQYNGTFEVLEVVDADSYRVHVEFSATDTGSWTSALIFFVTAAHGLSVGDGVQILADTFSNNYDAGYRILSTTVNNFVVNGTFVATDTGTWSTDSLTETDPRMRVIANAGIPDSKVIGSGGMNANGNVTIVTASTYAAIDVTGTAENIATQRFVLTDAAAGEFTYIGQEDLAGDLTAVISTTKTGSVANYRFAVSINGAVPVFASASYAPMEVKTTKVSTTVLKPVNIVTNDTVQIMVAGDGTADDITITDFSIEIRGD